MNVSILHSARLSTRLPWLLAFLCILAGLQNLLEYLQPGLNLFLALMAAPFVLKVRQPGIYSHRYAVLAILFLCTFAIVHMQIFFLLGLGSTVFYVVESNFGKLGILPLVLLGLLSPVPAYLAEIFTFPVRLWMSEQTANLFTGMGMAVTHSGNVFEVADKAFSVDPACMGLQSMITGLIVTVLLIAFGEKRLQRRLSVTITALLFLGTWVLLLLSNFIRMSGLVLFHSMPETLSHELIGIISLVVYVLLPMYGVIHFSLKKWGKPFEEKDFRSVNRPLTWGIALLLIGTIGYFNFHRKAYRNISKDPAFATIEMPGFEKTVMDNGIAKFENESLLVYLKPPTHFWGSDHSPHICWRASGYQLKQIQEQALGAYTVYIARLEKDTDLLYTAWWYDNGETQTHSQLDWRIRRLQGEKPFRLVNVTAAAQETLLAYCEATLSQ